MTQEENKQTCKCGSETYHIRWERIHAPNAGPEVWCECANCGRPTASLGDGEEKMSDWYANGNPE